MIFDETQFGCAGQPYFCRQKIKRILTLQLRPTRIRDKEMYEDEYTESEFEGTHVHDVEGWSDDDIYDVLDGDPEAYWNID